MYFLSVSLPQEASKPQTLPLLVSLSLLPQEESKPREKYSMWFLSFCPRTINASIHPLMIPRFFCPGKDQESLCRQIFKTWSESSMWILSFCPKYTRRTPIFLSSISKRSKWQRSMMMSSLCLFGQKSSKVDFCGGHGSLSGIKLNIFLLFFQK